MKRFLLLFIGLISLNVMNARTLVAYYSNTNTTRQVVISLVQQIEADVVEIIPSEEGLDYTANNYAIGSQQISSIKNNPTSADSYPAIKDANVDISKYSTIIIATPLWWSQMAAPMQTFLFKNGGAMAGKNIGVIACSYSSGISGVVSDAKRLIPDGNFLTENLWFKNGELSNREAKITTWITNIGYSSLETTSKDAVEAKTRVMVISDPHLLTAENAEALSANAGGKLDKMSPAIFAKTVETIIQAKPEALLVCGDLTYNGETSGHTQMAAALTAIEAKGIPVLVIPGNHDIQNPNSVDASSSNVNPVQFKTLYGAFGLGDDSNLENISRDVKSLSWTGSLKGTNLGIIGLDANIYDETSSYYSDGCVRKSTINWMKAQAASLRGKGKMVVCMVHQELLEHVTGQSTLAQSTLLNSKYTQNPIDGTKEETVTLSDLQKAFADAGIQYVMTGHFHIHHTQNKTVTNSANEDCTLTELTTGGLTTYPNWMRTLIFDTENNALESSTSTMVQTQVGTLDLQSVSMSELSTWATATYGQQIAAGIAMMSSDVEKYEIYDGTTQYQVSQSSYPEVQYTRTFKNNNWQALYTPFDIQYSDWSNLFEVAVFNSTNEDNLIFTVMKEGDVLTKNTPALIRLKDENPVGQYTLTSSVKTSGKTLVQPINGQTVSQSGITLHGTNIGLTGDYMYQNSCFALSSGTLKTVGDSANGNQNLFLAPQRWYLTESSQNNISSFKLRVEEETTNIDEISNDELNVGKCQKFIKDGKLVIVRGNKMFNINGQEVK